MIVFDPDPTDHVTSYRALFGPLRKHHLKLSPAKDKIGTFTADFLGHTMSAGGYSSNSDKVATLTRISMPTDTKQVRSLLGGINYYGKFLPNISRRLRPINALLKQGANFDFTPAMEPTVRAILPRTCRTTDPCLLRLGRGRRKLQPVPPLLRRQPRRLRSDPGARTTRRLSPPHPYISRATLDSEHSWTPLDLEAGRIIRAIKQLREHLWSTRF